jgi:hypothetical protein
MDFVLDLLAYWLGTRWADGMSKDHRDDPVYKRNVQDLIKRHRQFEKKE